MDFAENVACLFDHDDDDDDDDVVVVREVKYNTFLCGMVKTACNFTFNKKTPCLSWQRLWMCMTLDL